VNTALITNDAVVLGLLATQLAVIFKTESMPRFKTFYTYVPGLLLCYFLPSVFNSVGLISGEHSSLYLVTSRYLLPASLILLTLSIDLKQIVRLGPKALVMFLTATVGIVIGGPIAILAVSALSPDTVGGAGPDAVWRGLTTVAGSWIGGGANQVAMKEVFNVGDELFSAMIAVDVFVAKVSMAFLFYGAANSARVDRWLQADTSSIELLKGQIEGFRKRVSRIPSLTDTMVVCGVALGITGLAHFLADGIAPWFAAHHPELSRFSLTSQFFWLMILATTIGLALSFTPARNLEGVGASRLGSVFLYLLVATIGMKMDVMSIFSNPGLFLIGLIWILFHLILLMIVAKLIKAPFFFAAVGSQANVGGAASAPVVASAFHPSLAPVGVLLAVLGYAIGTYGAYACGLLMQLAAQGQ
jgi:uncharacterized membrane protein